MRAGSLQPPHDVGLEHFVKFTVAAKSALQQTDTAFPSADGHKEPLRLESSR
jgi:hypothetical protein